VARQLAGVGRADSTAARQLGPSLPVVYRWPYDYSLPDAADDYVPQTIRLVPAGAGTDRR